MENHERNNRKTQTTTLHTLHLLQKVTVSKIDLCDKAKIAKEFNKFFANIRIELASEIPTTKTTFETYVETMNSTMESNSLSITEQKHAFFYLKINKSPGHNKINFSVPKKCFGGLYDPLKFIFVLSLEIGNLP